MTLRRLLFASCHSYIDPSSGAAWATRDVLELMAANGVECRSVSTTTLGYERETPVGPLLEALGVPIRPAKLRLDDLTEVDLSELDLGGVGVTLVHTASSLVERSPNRAETYALLRQVDHALEKFQPQVVLTYGGHPSNLALMALARRKGIPVVFHLHNLAYDSRHVFADVSGVLVPSEYSRRHYAGLLGLDCAAIPLPLVPDRVISPVHEPRYVTFINPQLSKGAGVFARIAAELHERRPDIPFLVVDGRRTADGLAQVQLDLSGLRNLNRTANTPNPRAIYGLTRVLLVPSLVRESFGRVASEALANGIPVLASDRGALPETLGDAGFVFTLPEHFAPTSSSPPTAREVWSWITTIERLWDDLAWLELHRDRAAMMGERWQPHALSQTYRLFLGSHVRHA